MSCIILKNNAGQSSLLVEYLSEKGFDQVTIGSPSFHGVKIAVLRGRYRYAIIDAELDGGADGFELARFIKKTSPGTCCVMCIDPDSFDPDFLFRFDVSGYLSGDHSLKELLECFSLLQEGYRFVCNNLRLKLARQRDFTPGPEECGDPAGNAGLSKQEKKILQLLRSGKNTAEIAGELFLSSNTINNYKTSIRKKLNLDSNRQLITYAIHHQ